MFYQGDYAEDSTVYIMFNTFTSDDPSASSTITNFANTDVHIHKDNGLTQRNNAAGVTVSIDFDGITGSHMIAIDTSDDTVVGFWVAGADYFVRIEGTTIDGATVNAVIGHFSIENRFNEVDMTKILGHLLTQTGTQVADAFEKFFDVATPTGTVNSLPDAAPDAAGGLPISDAGGLDLDGLLSDATADITLTGTASAGSLTTITLAGGVATDNYYNGQTVILVGGTGAGQSRTILSYAASTVATVTRDWAVAPDATSQFMVIGSDVPAILEAGTAQAGAAASITLDATASATTDIYKNNGVMITGGTGVGQTRLIGAYNGATKVATVIPNWTTNPDNTSVYQIIPMARVDVGGWGGALVTLSSGNLPDVNVAEISDDSTAANNLELDYDGTGYTKANSTIGTTTTNTDMRGTDNAALASVLGALNNAAAVGDPTDADTVMQYIKQLINVLIGSAGIGTFPAEAAPGDGVSLAEVIRAVHTDVTGLNGAAMRGTDGANTTVPDAAGTAAGLHGTTDGLINTAQADLDTITGADGVTLATAQGLYAPAKAGDAMTLSAGAVTASVIATDAIDADAIKADAVTEIQSGLATEAKLLKYTQLLARSDAAIETDNATELTAINADGGSGAGNFSSQTDAVEAIRDRGDAAWITGGGGALTAADIVNEWEAQSQADPTGFHVNVKEVNGVSQTANDNGADINAILVDTNELQGDLTDDGRLDLLIDQIITAIAALNNLSAAQINAQVVDVINTDTSGEPAQGAPPATASLRTKLDYLYKFMRNKIENDGTTISVYADNGSTVDHKSTVSDDGTTFTRGEFTTGA